MNSQETLTPELQKIYNGLTPFSLTLYNGLSTNTEKTAYLNMILNVETEARKQGEMIARKKGV
jgi:hypothetical protein